MTYNNPKSRIYQCTDKASSVSADEEAGLGKFISGMVTKSTITRYQSGWASWMRYLQSLSENKDDVDPYLLRAKDDRERACRIGLFLKERYEVKGLRDRADRKSTRLNSSHERRSRMPSSA